LESFGFFEGGVGSDEDEARSEMFFNWKLAVVKPREVFDVEKLPALLMVVPTSRLPEPTTRLAAAIVE
jgi:hypothetical protein